MYLEGSSRILLSALVFTYCSCKCPSECSCDFQDYKRRAICNSGGLSAIPIAGMDTEVQHLWITAPEDNPNYLSLGRVFQDLGQLEQVRITHSNIPAIGDSSFWPGKRMRILDLSHNNISILKGTDFHGLSKLQILNLSNNNIAATPSAPFRFLTSLRVLYLSHNKLHSLVPRFFFMIPKLEHLDLSGNPITHIEPDDLNDLKPLKKLNLSNCRLFAMGSGIYQQLPNLQELDLSFNQLEQLAMNEFLSLRKIKMLTLRGNQLTALIDKNFNGLRLEILDLSTNFIGFVSRCAFCNMTVRDLDISSNQVEEFPLEHMAPFTHAVKSLDISQNPMNTANIGKLVHSLTQLRWFSASGTELVGEPPPWMFYNNPFLTFLNLSSNRLANISYEMLQPLKELTVLDISNNQFQSVYPLLLDQLNNMTMLKTTLLHQNPWNCEKCRVHFLITWLRQNPLSFDACQNGKGIYIDDEKCPRCSSPFNFAGRDLVTLPIHTLPLCVEPVIAQAQMVKLRSPQIGLAVGLFIIVFVLLIITVVVFVYRRHGAVYYTNEEDRMDQNSCISQELTCDQRQYKHRPSVFVTSSQDPIEQSQNILHSVRRSSYI